MTRRQGCHLTHALSHLRTSGVWVVPSIGLKLPSCCVSHDVSASAPFCEIGADLIRSVYMNNKGEDRILYPKISKKEI